MLSSNQTVYYITASLGQIFTFDDNWNYVATKSSLTSVTFMITIGCFFFITSNTNIWKTDQQLNLIKQYNPVGTSNFKGLFYNSTNNWIYVAAQSTYSIQLFDLDLTLKGNISTSPYQPWAITGYINQIFVGTTNGTIIVIVNEQVINQFNVCGGSAVIVESILLDKFGNMATACSGNFQLYLYNINGTFKNKSMSVAGTPWYINFDSKSRLVVVSYGHGIYVFN